MAVAFRVLAVAGTAFAGASLGAGGSATIVGMLVFSCCRTRGEAATADAGFTSTVLGELRWRDCGSRGRCRRLWHNVRNNVWCNVLHYARWSWRNCSWRRYGRRRGVCQRYGRMHNGAGNGTRGDGDAGDRLVGVIGRQRGQIRESGVGDVSFGAARRANLHEAFHAREDFDGLAALQPRFHVEAVERFIDPHAVLIDRAFHGANIRRRSRQSPTRVQAPLQAQWQRCSVVSDARQSSQDSPQNEAPKSAAKLCVSAMGANNWTKGQDWFRARESETPTFLRRGVAPLRPANDLGKSQPIHHGRPPTVLCGSPRFVGVRPLRTAQDRQRSVIGPETGCRMGAPVRCDSRCAAFNSKYQRA